ncbi:MAG: hypothetical protein R2763_01180 [Mycobacterium sp.]
MTTVPIQLLAHSTVMGDSDRFHAAAAEIAHQVAMNMIDTAEETATYLRSSDNFHELGTFASKRDAYEVISGEALRMYYWGQPVSRILDDYALGDFKWPVHDLVVESLIHHYRGCLDECDDPCAAQSEWERSLCRSAGTIADDLEPDLLSMFETWELDATGRRIPPPPFKPTAKLPPAKDEGFFATIGRFFSELFK